jgi:protein TonB
MDFAQQQRNPTKHLVGLTFVALLHVVIIWALINGLATKVIALVKAPIETKIIEEVKPPPPPEVKLPPPPKLAAPPPPYIPPPEVQIQVPQIAPTITSTQVAPPKQDFTKAPEQVAVAPKPKGIAGNCSNVKDIGATMSFPVKAQKQGLTSGHAEITFTVAGGVVTVDSQKGSNKLFIDVAAEGVRQLKCQDGRYSAPFEFNVAD